MRKAVWAALLVALVMAPAFIATANYNTTTNIVATLDSSPPIAAPALAPAAPAIFDQVLTNPIERPAPPPCETPEVRFANCIYTMSKAADIDDAATARSAFGANPMPWKAARDGVQGMRRNQRCTANV